VTIEQLADALRAAREATVSTLSALFLGMRSYREDDAEAFARQALPLILAGQRTVAQVVALYIAEAAQQATVSEENPIGIPIPPIGIPDVDVTGRLGDVDFFTVYQRPFVTIWAELARRSPVDPSAVPDPEEIAGSMSKAVDKAEKRLASMVEMDLQQAEARAAKEAMSRLPKEVRPTHWRRVLVGEENCALCTIASTQRYYVEDLKAVHPGCDCKVRPVFPGEDDPDDDELLEAAHDAVEELLGESSRGGREPDYRKLMLASTKRHGELAAPLLANPRHDFTGPRGIPRNPAKTDADLSKVDGPPSSAPLGAVADALAAATAAQSANRKDRQG
jgi:hypothetical protein